MSWKIKYIEEFKIIEITYYGDVTGLDLGEAISERISLQHETGATLVLADASQCISSPSITDIYDLPDRIYIKEKSRRDTQVALVYSKNNDSKKIAEFFHTVAFNRGWKVKLFYNRENAFSWLINPNN